MKSGFANILKPAGITSSDTVVRIRRCLPKKTRVGHMGTLDPDASGILPIGVGKAARLFDEVINKRKTYIAEMTMGAETDTQDSSGTVTAHTVKRVSRADAEAVAYSFTGNISQIPPAYSAVKVGGKRLYDIAREGGEAVARERAATVYGIKILSFTSEKALLEIECGRGTYIRTLLNDMGRRLGCLAHMSYLTRCAAGPFLMRDAVTPDEFAAACLRGEPILLPMDLPLGHLPRVDVDANGRINVKNGRPIPADSFGILEGQKCRVYVDGIFAGIAKRSGEALRFEAMLMEDDE